MDYRAPFAGKKITVMGLGLLGRAVGDTAFLAECGAHLTVTDMKTEEQLAESVTQLKQYPNITFHLGGHVQEDFTQCDMVLKAAGVPLDSPYVVAAHAVGVPVVMSTALFAKYAIEEGATVVGVTGTRGKSTVTHMIYHTLQQTVTRLRSEQEKHVFLGGNVRGISTLAMLPNVQAGDIAVLELDSWQLQGFGDLGISPQVAVFTNLMPDHQNYYHSMDAYFADKANIFKSQKEGDHLIVGNSIAAKIQEATPPGGEPCIPLAIPADWRLKVPGEHNRENASLAAGALHALGLSESEIKDGLESFEGVEGRLQLVRDIDGIKIYNDNNSTTPEATIAALRALDEGKKRVVLIMGGSDKGLDANRLLCEVAKTCKRVILLAGSGTDRIVPAMSDYSIFDDLSAAIHEAVISAQAGDVILFSPAFASFGMFKNEYERNDRFVSIIQKLL